MSNVFFISDLHLGHKNILKFQGHTRPAADLKEHSQWLVQQWNSVVTSKDIVWVLGDVIFDKKHANYFKEMRGQKHMIWGNHDLFSHDWYRQYFNLVRGFHKKYGMFLSHAPIHPSGLRDKINVHGHNHAGHVMKYWGLVRDERYRNVCVDHVNGTPVALEDIKKGL